MTSLLLVSSDFIIIPLEVFDPPQTTLLVAMAWIQRIFWSVDIPLTFVTGFVQKDGHVEFRLKQIAMRYLLTWFILDFFIVGSDWFDWHATTLVGYARIGKASRIFRILRLLRLLRIVKIHYVMKAVAERLQTEVLVILIDIMKLASAIIGVAHLVACCWYGIGTQGPIHATWVGFYDIGSLSLSHRYVTSFHWALTQFTGGMDEFTPKCLLERIFAIIVYVGAFVMTTVYLSVLTSSMTRVHMHANQQVRSFHNLRRYMLQCGITQSLAVRIQRNARHALCEEKSFTPESSVELLSIVSEPLLIDLHFELYAPVMATHRFFSRYSDECPHVMRKVCHCATSMTQVALGDSIFQAGEIPAQPKLYILCSGTMQYVSHSGAVTNLEAMQWISEATLWTTWTHLGVLTATSECRLVLIDALLFPTIVSQFEHNDVKADPWAYAQDFTTELNRRKDDVSDIPPAAENARKRKWVTTRLGQRSMLGLGKSRTRWMTTSFSG